MSNFGKKSINWWDWDIYDSHLPHHLSDLGRWHRTDKDIQLLILNKWYPIGMLSNDGWVITGYIEMLYGWNLKVKDNHNYMKEVHPLKFIPCEGDRKELLRSLRLGKLLD